MLAVKGMITWSDTFHMCVNKRMMAQATTIFEYLIKRVVVGGFFWLGRIFKPSLKIFDPAVHWQTDCVQMKEFQEHCCAPQEDLQGHKGTPKVSKKLKFSITQRLILTSMIPLSGEQNAQQWCASQGWKETKKSVVHLQFAKDYIDYLYVA